MFLRIWQLKLTRKKPVSHKFCNKIFYELKTFLEFFQLEFQIRLILVYKRWMPFEVSN